jgi:hypothetical protein
VSTSENDHDRDADYVDFNGSEIPLKDYNSALVEQATNLGDDGIATILRLNGAVINREISGEHAWEMMVNTLGEEAANQLFQQKSKVHRGFFHRRVTYPVPRCGQARCGHLRSLAEKSGCHSARSFHDKSVVHGT